MSRLLVAARTSLCVLLIAASVPAVAQAEDPDATAPAAFDGRAKRGAVVTYSVDYRGAPWSPLERRDFGDVVHATLNDPRGWSLNRVITFNRVRGGGAFTVVLATPGVVDSHGICSAYWSCYSGRSVLINSDRWFGATPLYSGQPRLQLYRQLVINHEVGHALGLGHAGCSGAGDPAPAMMQQSKGLHGCVINPWPVQRERAFVAARRGVRIGFTAPRIVPGRGAGFVMVGDTRRTVRARLGQPQRRAGTSALPTDVYSLFGLHVSYAGGRVSRVTTRSKDDRTRLGIGLGSPVRLVRALPRTTCDLNVAGTGPCVHGRATQSGDRPTTFHVLSGRVSAVEIERITG